MNHPYPATVEEQAMSFLGEDWHGQIQSGGWREGGGGDYSVFEPATGNEIGRIGAADAADVARAACAAHAAQAAWAATPHEERSAVLRRAGDLWERHAEELGGWIVREAGSIPPKAGLETHVAAAECFEAASLPSRPYGELLPSSEPRLSLARRLPVGVVGVIAPFNFPLILAIRSVAPALALGNAVLLKPDPRTAVSGGVSLARVFEEAGLPESLLHVLPGRADVGEALIDTPEARVISFTGSTKAGRRVGERAARQLKRAHLELGGNSALIVLPGADLEKAVGAAAWGSFLHQGQICMTTGRHLVHDSLAEEYVQRLSAKADALPVGDPSAGQVALGPIIDEHQRDHIHELVTASASAGARVAAGGSFEGLFYRPTVLADVRPSTPAYAEEVFGPVAPVLSFSTIEEAVQLANATDYGLSLGILAGDAMEGLELANRIPSGLVHINDQTVGDEANIPFGGVGVSGTGSRFGGAQANVEAFTDTQWVTIRREIPTYPF